MTAETGPLARIRWKKVADATDGQYSRGLRTHQHASIRRLFPMGVASFLLALVFAGSGEATDPAFHRQGGTTPTNPSFGRDIIPALTKAGCNSGACHGSFQGRGGLQLSLLGFDAAADMDALTKASRGRRINTSSPADSLLLLKATGAIGHGGGRRISEDSEVAELLRRWLTSGRTAPTPEDLVGLRLSVEPKLLRLQPESQQSIRVMATFGDGESRDVTSWALFDTREERIADVTRTGTVTARTAGRTAVSVRYLGQVATVDVLVPYSGDQKFEFAEANFIDEIVAAEWRTMGVRPASLADDATFLRRVYLDLIGTLPTADEARAFLAETAADKRSTIVDQLLRRPEYVDYWSLRWGDLLRAHRRYLGDKGLASYSGWIRQSVRDNKPIDEMTRELLTAQGNLFTNGPVGYYFVDEKVEDLAETTAQVFLGVRLQCTRCHHHPNEVWSQDDYYGLAAFFSRLETKDSGLRGARFGGPKSIRPVAAMNPQRKPQVAAEPRLFGATTVTEVDPRQHLADWITDRGNPFFAKNFANRYWAALLGRGLVEPVDDLRDTNPASMPALLDALAKEFTDHDCDAQHLLRTICKSRVYQLDYELSPDRDQDGQLCTHRRLRRLPAEVLLDAVNQVTETPEVFPGQPPGTRAIALPDPTIASAFLTTFGRPQRSNPCDCARSSSPDLAQALHLVNSPAMHNKVTAAEGRLSKLLAGNASDRDIVDELYLAAFARFPTDQERADIDQTLQEVSPRTEAWQDVLWALLNTAEFEFQH